MSHASNAHLRIQTAIKNIISQINPFFNPTQIRVSFLQYGDSPNPGIFRFSQLSNTIDILEAIDSVPLLNGSGADIKPALVQAINFLESTSSTSVKHVLWFTDQPWWEDVSLETDRLQELATVYAIGIDTDNDPNNNPNQVPLLTNLASSINGLQTVFFYSGFYQLQLNSITIADQMRSEYDVLCNSDTTVSHFETCVSNSRPDIDLLLVVESDNSYGNLAWNRLIDGIKFMIETIDIDNNPTNFRVSLLQHGSETSNGVFQFRRRTTETSILSGLNALTHMSGSGPNWEVVVNQAINFLDDETKFFYESTVKQVIFFTDSKIPGNYPNLELYAHRLQQIATVYAVGIDGDASTATDWKLTELINILASGPLWSNNIELQTVSEYSGFVDFKNNAIALSQSIRSNYDGYCNANTSA